MNLYLLKGGTFTHFSVDTLWIYEPGCNQAYCIHFDNEDRLSEWNYCENFLNKTIKI